MDQPLSVSPTLYDFLCFSRRKIHHRIFLRELCRSASWAAIGFIPIMYFHYFLGLPGWGVFTIYLLCSLGVASTFAKLRHLQIQQVLAGLDLSADKHDHLASGVEFLSDPDPFKKLALRQTEQWLSTHAQAIDCLKFKPKEMVVASACLAALLLAWWLAKPPLAQAEGPTPPPVASQPASQPSSNKPAATKPSPASRAPLPSTQPVPGSGGSTGNGASGSTGQSAGSGKSNTGQSGQGGQGQNGTSGTTAGQGQKSTGTGSTGNGDSGSTGQSAGSGKSNTGQAGQGQNGASGIVGQGQKSTGTGSTGNGVSGSAGQSAWSGKNGGGQTGQGGQGQNGTSGTTAGQGQKSTGTGSTGNGASGSTGQSAGSGKSNTGQAGQGQNGASGTTAGQGQKSTGTGSTGNGASGSTGQSTGPGKNGGGQTGQGGQGQNGTSGTTAGQGQKSTGTGSTGNGASGSTGQSAGSGKSNTGQTGQGSQGGSDSGDSVGPEAGRGHVDPLGPAGKRISGQNRTIEVAGHGQPGGSPEKLGEGNMDDPDVSLRPTSGPGPRDVDYDIFRGNGRELESLPPQRRAIVIRYFRMMRNSSPDSKPAAQEHAN